MANIDVNKRNNEGTEQNRGEMVKREGRHGLSRSRDWDPFDFGLTPSDMFSGSPFSMMRRMHDEMDRAFGRAFGNAAGGGLSMWSPAVEVSERDGNLQVHADLPGLKPEDVKIEVTDDNLIIQGERKSEQKENKGGMYRSERHYGQFYRAIPLPEGADVEHAKAQFNNGVLEVTLPVPQQSNKRRQIPIQGGSTSEQEQQHKQQKK